MNFKPILEGLLFICGEEGITFAKLKEILEISENEIEQLLQALALDYSCSDRGIALNKYGDKIKLVTKKEYGNYFSRLLHSISNESLSQAALETLAVIAYNEPITRSNIDEIRGVDSSHIVRKLLVRSLIEEKGKADLPGRPMLYGVTNDFLDHFGLHDISELPVIENKPENNAEKDLYDIR